MTQLALDLPHRESHRGEDFYVAAPNAAATRLVDSWPDWLSHALMLIGPEGSGKSHLASVWQARSGAVRLDAKEAGSRSLLMSRATPAVILEDIDAALADAVLDPVDLFHLYNWIRERRGFLLMSGRSAPAHWAISLKDLRSRLIATPLIEIGPPDDSLLAAVMIKRLHDRQLRVDPPLVGYVTSRIERSFGALETFLEALDRESLARRRVPGIPLARELLKSLVV